MKVITFHNPDEENGCFSNWYLSDFTIGDVKYTSLEQYMMHQKALRFHDESIAAQILATDDVSYIKELGRKVSGFDNHVVAKFTQNPELKRALLDTGNAVLVEAAVNDKIWGIGLSMSDPKRVDPSEWKGQNLMGYVLMLVREKLR